MIVIERMRRATEFLVEHGHVLPEDELRAIAENALVLHQAIAGGAKRAASKFRETTRKAELSALPLDFLFLFWLVRVRPPGRGIQETKRL
jgi:hypothetical protein